MIIDARELSKGTCIDADICIIGAGAAGITLAQELSGLSIEVCMLESGGLSVDEETEALAAGETSGLPYFDLRKSHPRVLGGATSLWGARAAPMKDIDFQVRPWVPLSGWPLALQDLLEYYERAHRYIGMHTPFDYDDGVWKLFEVQPFNFDETRLLFSAFQYGKTILFGKHYRAAIRQAANIKLFLHANVTNIQNHPAANHIEHVDVRTLNGKHFQVIASIFILACGGIENPRLMLLSNTVEPHGIGNQKDLLGRFFMEHPTTAVGTLAAEDMHRFCDNFSPGLAHRRLIEVSLALSPELQRSEGCLNTVVSVKPVLGADATDSLRRLLWDGRRGTREEPVATSLKRIFSDPVGLSANLYRHLKGKPKLYNIRSLLVEARSEQEPTTESRVSLSEEKDAFGLRRPHLHWVLSDLVKHSMRVTGQTFGREVARLGLGRFIMDNWLIQQDTSWSPKLVGAHHHMGTTRMSKSSQDGVVDKNCKVHTVDNLYAAGSSVFPTGGYVNPTLTILALAIRLADHLKTRLKARNASVSP
jgi:choline dehydrogenase-like flavoprotein